MFDKLKNQLDVIEIKNNDNFDRSQIENKLIYTDFINTIQNNIIQR